MFSSGNNQEREEKLLLQLVAKGDETAFALLIARYRKRVFTHTLTFTVRYEEAEELTQDIFIKIWQNRATLDSLNSFADYLFIISRNYLITHLRKRIKEARTLELGSLAEEIAAPDDPLQAKEMEALIVNGITRMPAQQQTVFRLSRQEGLSYEEISARLDISKSTVKWHIISGLRFLKIFLRLP